MKWFWSGRPLASASEVSSGSTVTSNVILTGLKRSDDGILLTCEAQNNNISTPVKHSVVVTMNCKFNLKSVLSVLYLIKGSTSKVESPCCDEKIAIF